jgi:hypothetical protein
MKLVWHILTLWDTLTHLWHQKSSNSLDLLMHDSRRHGRGTCLLPDAILWHMVKECRKLFSTFLCSKNVTKSHVFPWFRHFRHFANWAFCPVLPIFWQLFDNFLTVFLLCGIKRFDNFENFFHFFDNFLTTFWQLFEKKNSFIFHFFGILFDIVRHGCNRLLNT